MKITTMMLLLAFAKVGAESAMKKLVVLLSLISLCAALLRAEVAGKTHEMPANVHSSTSTTSISARPKWVATRDYVKGYEKKQYVARLVSGEGKVLKEIITTGNRKQVEVSLSKVEDRELADLAQKEGIKLFSKENKFTNSFVINDGEFLVLNYLEVKNSPFPHDATDEQIRKFERWSEGGRTDVEGALSVFNALGEKLWSRPCPSSIEDFVAVPTANGTIFSYQAYESREAAFIYEVDEKGNLLSKKPGVTKGE